MSALLRAVLSLGKFGGVLVSHLWRAISNLRQQPRVVALVQPQVQEGAMSITGFDINDYKPWECPRCGRMVTSRNQMYKRSVGRIRRCTKCRTVFTRHGVIVQC